MVKNMSEFEQEVSSNSREKDKSTKDLNKIPSEVEEKINVKDEQLDSKGEEKENNETLLSTSSEKSIERVTITPSQVEVILPFEEREWLSKPWVYTKPKYKKFLESWYELWGQVFLDYGKHMNCHILVYSNINSEYPFKSKKGKTLTLKNFQDIGNKLVTDKQASWHDKEHRILRIYWISRSELIHLLNTHLNNTGQIVEVLVVSDLQRHTGKPWSTLEAKDIHDIFKELVENKMAEWVSKKQDSIVFNI